MHTSKPRAKILINYNVVLIAGLSYIYLPIVIFLFGFTKLYIALPVAVVLLLFLRTLLHDYSEDINSNHNGHLEIPWRTLTISILALLFFCLLCGYGSGYFPQASDWNKHNAILHDLTEQSWPVYYVKGDEHSMLTYYIAHYIVPCFFGNIFHSFALTEWLLLLWNFIGLILVFFSLIYLLKISTTKRILLTLFVMLFYSGALLLAQGAAEIFYGEYMHTSELTPLARTMWFQSDVFKLQYKSAFTSLRWTFHQWLTPCLMTTLFLRFKNQPQHYVLLLLPMVLYASLSFLGFLPIVMGQALYLLCTHKKKQEILKRIFGLENIIVFLLLGGILILYFYGNILSEKPAHIAPYLVKYGNLFGCYTIYCFFMFGIHALLVYKRYRKDAIFISTVATLLSLPLFNMGRNNDFVLSGGTIGMFLIMFYILDYLFHETNTLLVRIKKYALIVLMVIGIICPIQEVIYILQTNMLGTQVADNLQTLNAVADRLDNTIRDDYKYNYFSYDIEHNIFYKYIARRKIQ